MNTRTGKIARLPKNLREQINERLENGELAKTIVTWLNQLPEVQKLITEQFGGHAIRTQNISEWRKGGYLDWQRYQLLREQTHWTAEQAGELGLDTTGKSISIAEDIATVMSAELALHVQALSAIKNPKQRFRQFRHLARELSRLRRDDQRALRTQLRHPGRLHLDPQHTATGVSPVSLCLIDSVPKPTDPPESPTSPTPGAASVPASRAPTKTDAHEIIEPVAEPIANLGAPASRRRELEETKNENSSTTIALPTAETPKPLNPSVRRSEAAAAQTQPPYNPPLPPLSTINSQLPTNPNPTKTHHKIFSIPVRGRRFRCIEG